MAVIGIDLGTTNSLACVCQDGRAVLIPNSLGENLTPSVVSVGENGEICVGAVAKERLISHPEASASSFKRYMGTNKVFTLAGNNFTPQELSSFVLRQLKEDAERYLGEEVTEAVISVPAYFNDNQRYATREAGRLAGIHVERLVNEPSAAALTTSRISGEEEGSYLVFDFSRTRWSPWGWVFMRESKSGSRISGILPRFGGNGMVESISVLRGISEHPLSRAGIGDTGGRDRR